MKSEQHIPDCDSWLVRPPAWLCSVSTRNIWKFCLSVLRFPSFISDWLICFPHSESTNIEQQEITINGCLGPSAVHCSIWMHMRATPLTNTEFLHINTLCSHTLSPIGPSASSKSCQCPRITSSWSPLFLWSSDHWAENHLQGKKTSKHPTKSSDWKKKRWKYPKKRALRCWKMSFNKRLWRRKREKCFVGVSRGVFFLQLWSLKKEMVNDGKRCPWTDSCQADFVVIVCHREMKSYSPNPSSRCGLWSRSVQFLFNQSQILLLQCQLLQSLKKMTADSPWSPWVAAAAVRAVMHLWKCKRMSAKDWWATTRH